MKAYSTLSLAILLSTLSFPSYADSEYQRDLATLIEQRDNAIAKAIEPINDRFQQHAEQLLRRAMQDGDLAAATAIKAAITEADPEQNSNSLRDLKKQLSGTTWILAPEGKTKGGLTDKLTFAEETVAPGGYKYETARRSLVITFSRGATQVLELTRDGRHLQYPDGEIVYELSAIE